MSISTQDIQRALQDPRRLRDVLGQVGSQIKTLTSEVAELRALVNNESRNKAELRQAQTDKQKLELLIDELDEKVEKSKTAGRDLRAKEDALREFEDALRQGETTLRTLH